MVAGAAFSQALTPADTSADATSIGRIPLGMRQSEPEFFSLANHLAKRRSALLQQWRAAVIADTTLTSGSALPRVQLDDHVPFVLEAFERQLLPEGQAAIEQSSAATVECANAHGLHRWQQGYKLQEVVRELGYLNRVMIAELDAFGHMNKGDDHVMAAARQSWAAAYTTGVEQSTSQFFKLQQAESLGHVTDLEAAMTALTEVDKQRAVLWEQMAHDLRGNVGVVAVATRALSVPNATADARERFTTTLERNVDSLRHLLDDVTTLSRLQAGVEKLKVEQFQPGVLIQSLCDGLQAMAEQRGLYLRTVEPAHGMKVQGDAVKVRRLAQNLIINALKYTQEGGVVVSWANCEGKDTARWRLTVKDTGPGIHAGPASPLAEALKDATNIANETADQSRADAAAVSPAQPAAQAPGEGIGLSIVKRLCEVLDATMEVKSDARWGSEFTILLPKSYPAQALVAAE